MIGAIAGDVIGSVHEGGPARSKDFPLFQPGSRFTDDTVLSIAVASAVMNGGGYAGSLREWGRRYPDAGYGRWFSAWLGRDDAPPYNSFGNGSAMRVAAVGWAFDDPEVLLSEAARSAEPTHDHPEGIKGAQAVASAIVYARMGRGKDHIAAMLLDRFGYRCADQLNEVSCRGRFDVTCQGTLPAAATAFLLSNDFEDALRNAISLGGDCDTLACIAGAISEAFYGGVPPAIRAETFRRLDDALRVESLKFVEIFGVPLLCEGG